MTYKEIDEATIDAAIAEARDFLDSNPDLSWIKKTTPTYRAYQLGIYAGLSAISDEDYLNKFLQRKIVDMNRPGYSKKMEL